MEGGSVKKRLDFVGNPDDVTLRCGCGEVTPRITSRVCFTQRLFNSNSFAGFWLLYYMLILG